MIERSTHGRGLASRSRRSERRSAAAPELAPELLDLVAQLRGVLEPQLLGGGEHLLLERDHELLELARASMPSTSRVPRRRLAGTCGASSVRNSAMSETPLTIDSGVMPCSSLYASCFARRRFVSLERALDRLGHACRRTCSTLPLMLRAARPIVWISAVLPRRKPSLSASRIGDERHLGQVEPLAQEVDADEHVVLAEPQVADDLDPLERVDLGVQVARLDARLEQVVGQVLGHLLRQRRDEHALAALLAPADLVQQVVDLVLRRAQLDLGVDEAGRADQLLGDDASSGAARTAPGRRRDEHELRHLARGTRRSAAAGCRAPTAAGSRSRRASACASGRPRTCRRSAARSGATRRRRRRSRREVVEQRVRRASPAARPSRMRE